MNNAIRLEDALALALKLSPRQRVQLIERIASSIEHDIKSEHADVEPPEASWGQNIVRLIDELDPIEMIHPEIEDATEWVKQIRRDQEVARGLNWDEAE